MGGGTRPRTDTGPEKCSGLWVAGQLGHRQVSLEAPLRLRFAATAKGQPDIVLRLLEFRMEPLAHVAGPPTEAANLTLGFGPLPLFHTCGFMLASYLLFPDSAPRILKPLLLPGLVTSVASSASRGRTRTGLRPLLLNVRIPASVLDLGSDNAGDDSGEPSPGSSGTAGDGAQRRRSLAARIRRKMGQVLRCCVPRRPKAIEAWGHAAEVLHQVAAPATLLLLANGLWRTVLPESHQMAAALVGLMAVAADYSQLAAASAAGRGPTGRALEREWHARHRRAARRVAPFLGDLHRHPPLRPLMGMAGRVSIAAASVVGGCSLGGSPGAAAGWGGCAAGRGAVDMGGWGAVGGGAGGGGSSWGDSVGAGLEGRRALQQVVLMASFAAGGWAKPHPAPSSSRPAAAASFTPYTPPSAAASAPHAAANTAPAAAATAGSRHTTPTHSDASPTSSPPSTASSSTASSAASSAPASPAHIPTSPSPPSHTSRPTTARPCSPTASFSSPAAAAAGGAATALHAASSAAAAAPTPHDAPPPAAAAAAAGSSPHAAAHTHHAAPAPTSRAHTPRCSSRFSTELEVPWEHHHRHHHGGEHPSRYDVDPSFASPSTLPTQPPTPQAPNDPASLPNIPGTQPSTARGSSSGASAAFPPRAHPHTHATQPAGSHQPSWSSSHAHRSAHAPAAAPRHPAATPHAPPVPAVAVAEAELQLYGRGDHAAASAPLTLVEKLFDAAALCVRATQLAFIFLPTLLMCLLLMYLSHVFKAFARRSGATPDAARGTRRSSLSSGILASEEERLRAKGKAAEVPLPPFSSFPASASSQTSSSGSSNSSLSCEDSGGEPAMSQVAGGQWAHRSLRAEHGAWQCLLLACRSSGAAFIKWGQWAATRGDLFPEAFCTVLSSLHDKAPVHGFQYSREQVEGSFGAPLEQLFARFDEGCFASGSIAQVHRALLRRPDGTVEDVAVKVRHPNVATYIALDFRILKPLAEFASTFSLLKGLPLRETLSQFSHTMTAQADLRVEAVHLGRFYNNFKGVKDQVTTPRPVHGMATESVLVESFEMGVSVSHFIAHPTSINGALVALGCDTYLKMLLCDNFVHTDLHPGNIMVRAIDAKGDPVQMSSDPLGKAMTPGELEAALSAPGLRPQLVLLDFGLAEELTQTVRHHFVSFLNTICSGDGQRAAHHLLHWAEKQMCPKPNEFVEDTVLLFAAHCDMNAPGGIDLDHVMKQVLLLVRKHSVSVDSSYASLLMAVVVIVGFAAALDPCVNIMDAAAPCLLLHSLTGNVAGRMYS
ncbi:MAG: hypothetical protein WDW36_005909 [Sanguina aurantia]